jgi:serine/threonine protein kinase
VGQTQELSADGEPRGPVPDPMLGRRLLHYRVLEVIGQGGMSVVYRGRDEHLARDVAIKVLHPFLAEKPECRVRLAREARAVARLTHPNILQVFDFSGDRPTLYEKGGVDDASGWPREGFIIAELVKGPTLKRFGESHALWRVPEVGALVVWQLLQALQHAHDHGIVHRDLKPENVMVREDGLLKLMDFGIAQVADQGGLTVTGTLLGSPAHMAPECIDGHGADERSDVFSMGTVLYWITTGSLPFEALTPHALLKQIVDGRAPPAQQKSPRVSDDLARVIARSMATKPAERFASAREFADALKEVLERAGLTVDDVTVRALLRSPPEQVPRVAADIRRAFLERARRALAEGQTARALGCLNRVLADDPADVDARALLDRLHVDEPATLDDVEPATDPTRGGTDPTGSALALAATSTPVPGSLVTTTTVPPVAPAADVPAPLRWQTLFVGVAAIGLVGLAVVVARAVDDVKERPGGGIVVEAPSPPSPPPPPGEVGTSRGEPAALQTPPAIEAGDDRRRPVAGTRRPPTLPKNPVMEITTPLVGAAPPPAPGPAQLTRRVTFRVKPWADIIVDGTVVAKNAMGHELDLPEGPHHVVFVNPRAREHEVRFTVTRDGPPPLVAARLDPRPALLLVRCNVPDAFVDVAGVGKPAADTVSRPLVVTLDEQSKAEREVFIYKKGFVAWRRRHTFVAGETLELDVVLEPDPGDSPAPAPTP